MHGDFSLKSSPSHTGNLWSFSHPVFALSNELNTQTASDWWVDRLTSTCIWNRSVRAFIHFPEQLNQADNQPPPCHPCTFPSGLHRDGETVGDMTLFVFFDVCLKQLSFRPPTLLPSPSSLIDLSTGTPEAIRRCWLVSLSLAWSVLSILVSSILRTHSLAFQLSYSHCRPSSTLFAITLTDNSLGCSPLSLSFTPTWISLSHYCVVSMSQCLAMLKNHWATWHD